MSKPKKTAAPKKAEPIKQTSKAYHLISRDEEKMPVTLSQEERDRCAIQLAELVEQKEALTEEKRDVVREWRVKLNAKQEEIDDCAAGVIRGAKPCKFTVEKRAIYKTRMIERVRTEDGLLVDSRPMTPEEEVQFLQTDIGDGRATRTLDREPAPDKPDALPLRFSDAPAESSTLVYSTGPDEPTEEQEEPEIDDDTRAALGGLPRGWRKVWIDAHWTIDGEANKLTGGDLFEVYLRIETRGSSTAEIHAKADFLSLGHVQRALGIMRRCGLVTASDDGMWFVSEEAPVVETEAGRNDPLPKAERPSRPKRRRAKDTGEAAINQALGQSDAMEATA